MPRTFEQLGLVGCGLMGGSFALALKRAGLVRRVVGYSRSPGSARQALDLGVLDAVADTAEQAATEADLILLAVPVAATASTLQAVRDAIPDQALVMDVGSTKSDVVQAAERILGPRLACFVPCHPIAGSEAAGVAHADAGLYAGAQVILTPTRHTATASVAAAQALWQALGCHLRVMTPEAHDAAFAAVSHLPHLLAFAYMDALAGQADGPRYLALAGPGFADFSRIGAANAPMWRDVFRANREQVLAQSRQFRDALLRLEALIASDDAEALETAIHAASRVRAQWRPGTRREKPDD